MSNMMKIKKLEGFIEKMRLMDHGECGIYLAKKTGRATYREIGRVYLPWKVASRFRIGQYMTIELSEVGTSFK